MQGPEVSRPCRDSRRPGILAFMFQSSDKSLIFLASASPRRSALLTQAGIAHEVRPVDIDERPLPGEAAGHYVSRLAAGKAEVLWRTLDERQRRPVIGSDTSVVLDGEILGKPRDQADGRHMLERLSGRSHQVFTAVALRHAGGCESRLSVSEVTFRTLGQAEIEAYWHSGEPHDKAGAYAVQGLAAIFIERIAGSFSGIMGLPLYETAELLRAIGYAPLGRRAVQDVSAA